MDGDRHNACEVLDSALAQGQLSMEEHRQRVSAATNAVTLGELQALVQDLQIYRASAQLQKMSPVLVWGIALAVVAVVLLLVAATALALW